MSVAEIDEGVFEATATIDNGSFGTRTIRFETGRLAKQAAGAVVAYLDDETMLLSATTASKSPKDHFDFFPLTIDVEERMYAAGRIPGSFFRREGRPSTDAILTCRLIDRPLRPTFVSGLRNEIQVVVTILSLDPKDLYDVLAINAASASTQISGLPFSGPVGGVAGVAAFAEVIHRDAASRLHFIPTGRRDADFRDFDLILDALSATYDFVVLLAPAFPGSEIAKVMAPYADFVVLTAARTDATRRLSFLKNELVEAGAHEVVVIGRAAAARRTREPSVA